MVCSDPHGPKGQAPLCLVEHKSQGEGTEAVKAEHGRQCQGQIAGPWAICRSGSSSKAPLAAKLSPESSPIGRAGLDVVEAAPVGVAPLLRLSDSAETSLKRISIVRCALSESRDAGMRFFVAFSNYRIP